MKQSVKFNMFVCMNTFCKNYTEKLVQLNTIYVKFEGEGHRSKFMVTAWKKLLVAGASLKLLRCAIRAYIIQAEVSSNYAL